MTDAQTYHPYRASLLTREQLRAFSTLRPAPMIAHSIIHWLIILASWAAAAIWTHPAIVALAVIVIGVNYYGLTIIAHDGLHRRLFNDVTRNDRYNDIAILGAIGSITRINRANHMNHHHVTCLKSDPDRHKYVHDNKAPPFGFLVFLSGLSNVWPTLRNVFLGGPKRETKASPRESYTLADIAILVMWQGALIVGLTWAFGWWGYPVMWLLPVYAFAYRADLTRVFCEHAMLAEDAAADTSMRLVTYKSSWLERQFFAPHNMNYHMAHHLWPQIPYYNLPTADAAIRAAAQPGDANLVWRNSYLAFLWRYARWRMTNERATAAPAGA